MAGNYLPGVLGLIADELGEDVAMLLATEFGGRVVYIPGSPKDGCRLATAVGLQNAVKISELLGKGDLLVPCGSFAGAKGKHAKIREFHRKGCSHAEIAEILDVHVRTVGRALSRSAEQNQLKFKL